MTAHGAKTSYDRAVIDSAMQEQFAHYQQRSNDPPRHSTRMCGRKYLLFLTLTPPSIQITDLIWFHTGMRSCHAA